METFSSEANRIEARFAELRASGRKALIPYYTAGYPDPAATAGILERLVRAGADLIELGVPFSDPLADGPTIQRTSQQAIGGGVTLRWTLEEIASFRRRFDTPIVLFTYLNPVMAYGAERLVEDAVRIGVDGILVTDLPVGCDPELEGIFERSPLALIRLVAPTTPPDRLGVIAERARGFLYYISRTGVTGAGSTLRDGLTSEVTTLREQTSVPIAVGFGISTPEQAAEVARVADGVIVGSALIHALDEGGPEGMERWLATLRTAMDEVGG